MEFRELEVKDYPSFLKLYNETFPADERRLYKSAEHVASFVKEKGGKFKGFVYDDGGDDFVGKRHHFVGGPHSRGSGQKLFCEPGHGKRGTCGHGPGGKNPAPGKSKWQYHVL